MAKRPSPSSKRPTPKAAAKPAPKPATKQASTRAPKPAPKALAHNHQHVAAISAAVIALLGPFAVVRSISPASAPRSNRWVPHLKRPILRSEHEPRRRSPLTRKPPR